MHGIHCVQVCPRNIYSYSSLATCIHVLNDYMLEMGSIRSCISSSKTPIPEPRVGIGIGQMFS